MREQPEQANTANRKKSKGGSLKDAKAHLHAILGRLETEFCDGLIEIAYTPSKGNYAVTKAKHFVLSEGGIEAGAEFAIEQNAKGSNIYINQALLDPETPRFKRAADQYFYAATALCVDADEDASKVLKNLYAHVQPSLRVQTGSKPKPRLQVWCEYDEPCTNVDEFKDALASLTVFSGADVQSKGALLRRLAGTINYPNEHKATNGYIRETTAILEPEAIQAPAARTPDYYQELAPQTAQWREYEDKFKANGSTRPCPARGEIQRSPLKPGHIGGAESHRR
ncbi:MAG: hypothetical protein ACR2OR_09085 [Hyphomicrobiales bacterium]